MAELGLPSPVQTGPGRVGCAARSHRGAWPNHPRSRGRRRYRTTGPNGSSCLPPAPARTRAGTSACGVPVRSPSRARHRHRRSQGPWAAPVGRGPVARACSAHAQGELCSPARRAQPTCCASPRQHGPGRAPPAAIAARPAGRGQSAVRRRPLASSCQPSPTAPAPTSPHPAPAQQPPGAGARPPAGPRAGPWPRGRSSPPATASSSAAATETKAPASRSPITGPRRTTAAARAGPQLHPGALLRPAALPEALPAAALVGLQHRGGLGPTADRRVAGQPDRLQQPPQRSDDVQLASRSVSHLRGSSCHRNACSPCWVWPAAPVPRQRTQRRSGSPATRSSSAYSRPSAAAITMVSDPWWIRTVSGTADRSHNPGIPVEPRGGRLRRHTG
jgi:hypothetical protein